MSVDFHKITLVFCLQTKTGAFAMALETLSKQDLLNTAVSAIEALRADGAIVHCITNTVAQNFTANVLLACGATPSMTVSPEEVPSFSGRSDAVLFNLGTLDEARKQAIHRSLEVCKQKAIPFVLDPVMCHVSSLRLAVAKEILSKSPAIIRANSSEAEVLGFSENNEIDANSAFALTGAVDQISYGKDQVGILNGDPLLAKVTAVGCAQGGLMAALLTKSPSPFVAAIAALIWVGVSGENAGGLAKGPGSFQAHFLDQLYSIETDEIKRKARFS